MQNKMRGQAEKVIARCRYLARFTEEPGQIKRTFLSAAMRECMHVVQGWMEAAGMLVVTDAAGNLRGRYPGAQSAGARSAAACLMIGSHLDTVPNSGAFDGILGVMMGLGLVEALEGKKLPFAIEVIGFSEEEGVRYSLPFIGSRALVGRLDPALLATKDGVTRLRGSWHKWRDIPVIVTYHPSYLLRQYNQQAKREAWEDLKTLLHFVYD